MHVFPPQVISAAMHISDKTLITTNQALGQIHILPSRSSMAICSSLQFALILTNYIMKGLLIIRNL